MIDSYNIYYVFREEITDDDLESIVSFLTEVCSVQRQPDGDVEAFVDELRKPTGYLTLEYGRTTFGFTLGTDDDAAVDLPTIHLWIDETYILPLDDESDEETLHRVDRLYNFLGELYEAFVATGSTPLYVYGLNFAEWDIASDPDHTNFVSAERLLDRQVPGIYWFQIFPPGVVEELGPDRVRSCPAFRLKQLDDGAVLLAGNQGVIVSEIEDYIEDAADHLDAPFEQ